MKKNYLTKAPRTPIEKSKILLTGPVRNVASKIEQEVENLLASFANFNETKCFVIESDSTDNTVKKLEELSQKIANFSFISMGQLSSKYPRRTDRIAFCRNAAIDAVASNPALADIDYIAMADMDGMNSLVTPEKIAECWTVEQEWDVITANQLGEYYDIWALRHPDWSPNDCWQQKTALEPVIGRHFAENLAITAKQVVLDPSVGLIEVDSAFGGLAIYRRSAFLAGRYAGTDKRSGFDVADHIPFHEDLRAQGYKIYINSRLINCARYPDAVEPNLPQKPRGTLKVIQRIGKAVFGKKRFNKYLDLMKTP
jgi:hypothetical protein